MTKQSEVVNNTKYKCVHEHGFVGLVDHMGSDTAVCDAARTSYGAGTKTVRENRGLIRHLMRERHTSPFEMCEIKIHVKLPIFVMRQWVRHRTASLNEYSGRYSVMSDEMYIPAEDYIQPQSASNKQGRAGEMSPHDKKGVKFLMDASFDHTNQIYQALLTAADDYETDLDKRNVIYDVYQSDDTISQELTDEYPGLTRELARIVMPVSNYTEMYWKQNLHNMLHLLKLRADSHAQREIQDYANALYEIIKPLFPLTIEAWEDYVRDSRNSSRMERNILQDLISADVPARVKFNDFLEKHGSVKFIGEYYGLSIREMNEFMSAWGFDK